jgi:hypothetical protein
MMLRSDRDDLVAAVNHPIEEWSDDEVIEQLRFIDFARTDLRSDDVDDDARNLFLAELERRGIAA